ncbi:Mu-like prophage I protein [Aggregatibacter aphrophilus]|uniref:Mu-like prophage I protein n=1 Tax=Aggregatibacter aphrophilus TaxID=732 RepID=A0A336N741_AGGAP|nr:Mu-like prophage I protein [Aggregatibacter aphrophilus]
MKTTNHPIAVLTAQINKTSADGWQQLLPKGEFRSRDGSPHDVPHWYIDETIAKRLIARLRALKQDALVDYEHETILKAKKAKAREKCLPPGGLMQMKSSGLTITSVKACGLSRAGRQKPMTTSKTANLLFKRRI